MTVDAKATFWENYTKVVAFFVAVVALMFGIIGVGQMRNQYEIFTFGLIAVFMLLWSITDWDVIEAERESESPEDE